MILKFIRFIRQEHLNVEQDLYEEGVQWRVLTNLGEGAFGTCYLAKEKDTDKFFCVKKVSTYASSI